MKKLIAIFFIILPFVSKGVNYSIGDTLYVVAINGLTIRSKANLKGEKIGVLKTYDKVCIIDTSNFEIQHDTIFGFRGNWVKIHTTEGLTGYVFDAFLSTLPPARSLLENGKTVPPSSFEYSQCLPVLLRQYAIDNFTQTGCMFEWSNRVDGTSAHEMRIQNFREGHVLIEHQYWEGTSTELSLKNVRISEVYYLIHQFLKDAPEEIFILNDHYLKNPKSYRVEGRCAGEFIGLGCGIEVYKDSENAYSIKFNFPCC